MGVWLPLFVLTLQLPSMLLLLWRWQLVNAKVVDEPAARCGSFSIRDLMVFTAVVAVTLVWYRWLLHFGGGRAISIEGEGWLALWWNAVGIAVAIVLPTWAWLAIRKLSYVAGWCLSVVYSVCVVAIGCAIHYWFDEFDFLGDILSIIAGMTLGFTLPMIVGLHLLRAFGWRLERPSAESPSREA